MTAGPRPEYVHHAHPYTPHFDNFGMDIRGCACGEAAIPGGDRAECHACLIERMTPKEQQR